MIRIIVLTLSIISLLVTVLPFLKVSVGIVRIWEFPRLQISFLIAVSLAGWLFVQPRTVWDWIVIGLLAASLFYQLYTVLPYTNFWRKQISDTVKKDDENSISILFYNVYMFNKKVDEFLKLAKEKDPDIILLVETDQYWAGKLEVLKKEYKFCEEVPIDNTYGMILYSRLSLTDKEVKYLLKDDIPSIHTYVQLRSGNAIKLYCVHPEPPTLAKSTVDRDAELLQVAKMIEKRKEPCIVAGDLNDVAWSDSTHLFSKISRCSDPRIGRGLLNSFHAKIPLMRWPLDHFFLSDDFTVDLIERQPAIGSDHYPMYIKFTFTPNGNEGEGAEPADSSDHQEANEKIQTGKEEN